MDNYKINITNKIDVNIPIYANNNVNIMNNFIYSNNHLTINGKTEFLNDIILPSDQIITNNNSLMFKDTYQVINNKHFTNTQINNTDVNNLKLVDNYIYTNNNNKLFININKKDISDTIVLVEYEQSLPNKRFYNPILKKVKLTDNKLYSNLYNLTIPDRNDTIVTTEKRQILKNKSFINPSIMGLFLYDNTIQLQNNKITFPDIKGSVITESGKQSMKQKIFNNVVFNNFKLTDNQFSTSSLFNLNIPDLYNNDEITSINLTHTLENKTLLKPKFYEPKIKNNFIKTISDYNFILSEPDLNIDTLSLINTSQQLNNKNINNSSFNNFKLNNTYFYINNNKIINIPNINKNDTFITELYEQELINNNIIISSFNSPQLIDNFFFNKDNIRLFIPDLSDNIVSDKDVMNAVDKIYNSPEMDNLSITTDIIYVSSKYEITIPTITNNDDKVMLSQYPQTIYNKSFINPKIPLILNGINKITIPIGTDTLIGLETIDTLTNKTLITPIINEGIYTNNTKLRKIYIDEFINDDTFMTEHLNQEILNKTFVDLKILSFNNGGSLIYPEINDILVGRNTIDDLTNKTFIQPTINMIKPTINTSLYLPIIINDYIKPRIKLDNLISRNSIDEIINKTFIHPIINQSQITNIKLLNDYILNNNKIYFPHIDDYLISQNNVANLKFKTIENSFLQNTFMITNYFISNNNNQLTFSNINDEILLKNYNQTISNKSYLQPIISDMSLNDFNIITELNKKLTIFNITENDTFNVTILSQTLKNKEFILPKISTIQVSNNDYLTLPTTIDTLIGRETIDTLTNKTYNHLKFNNLILQPYNYIKTLNYTSNIIDTTDYLINTSSNQTIKHKTFIQPIIKNIINNGITKLPILTSTIIGRETIDNLYHKRLTNSTINNPTIDNLIINDNYIKINNKQINLIPNNGPLINCNIEQQLFNKTLSNLKLYDNKIKNNSLNIFTFPNISDKIITKNYKQTISNKNYLNLKLENVKLLNNKLSTLNGSISITNYNDTILLLNQEQTLNDKIFNNSNFLMTKIMNNNIKLNNNKIIKLINVDDEILLLNKSQILKNKEYQTSTFKSIKINSNNIISNNSNLISIPDINDTLITNNLDCNLINKTLDSISINNMVLNNNCFYLNNTNKINIPNIIDISDTLITLNQNIQLNNKLLDDIKINNLKINNIIKTSSNNIITIPNDKNDIIIYKYNNQTLLNKTLNNPNVNELLLNDNKIYLSKNNQYSYFININQNINDDVIYTNNNQVLYNKIFNNINMISFKPSHINTISIPDYNDTLITLNNVITLNNKELIKPIIKSIKRQYNRYINIPEFNNDTFCLINKEQTLNNKIFNEITFNNTNTIYNLNSIKKMTCLTQNNNERSNKIANTSFVKNISSRFNNELSYILNDIIIQDNKFILKNNNIITIPNILSNDIFTTLNNIQPLNNKIFNNTLIYNIISPTNKLLNIPTIDDTLTTINNNDTLLKKTFINPIIQLFNNKYYINDVSNNDEFLLLNYDQILYNKTLIQPKINCIFNKQKNIITIPDISDTLINQHSIQTITKKTFINCIIDKVIHNQYSINIVDNNDTIVLNNLNQTLYNNTIYNGKYDKIITNNDNQLNFILSNDTLVNTSSIQTITNKTFINPILSSINSINDNKISFIENINDDICLNNYTQTLNNKTFINPIINKFIHNNKNINLLNNDDILTGLSNNQTLMKKTLNNCIIDKIKTKSNNYLSFENINDTIDTVNKNSELINKIYVSPIITGNYTFNDVNFNTLKTTNITSNNSTLNNVIINNNFNSNKIMVNHNIDDLDNSNKLNKKNMIHNNINKSIPCGTIILWTSNNIPSGWLLCNGYSLNVSEYPTLFSIIGYKYGGSNDTFNIPNIQGLYIRGNGNQNINGKLYKGILGEKQNDNFKLHNHNYNDSCILNDNNNLNGTQNTINNNFNHQTKLTNNYGTNNEVIPATISLYYIIKTNYSYETILTPNISNILINNKPIINNELILRYTFNSTSISNNNIGNSASGIIDYDAIMNSNIIIYDNNLYKNVLKSENNKHIEINKNIINNNQFCFVFWIKINNNGNIINFNNNSSDIFNLYVNNTSLYIKIYNGSNELINTNLNNIILNQWYLLTLNINNNQLELYLNDTMMKNITLNNTIDNINRVNKYIGDFDGYIYDFRYYNTNLILSQILQIYYNKG